MPHPIEQVFSDPSLVEKIKRRLPGLFHYAERDSSRAGKVGMEVGSVREKILVALLIYKFGRSNVQTELPITEHEVDVKVHGKSLSIKTLTTSSQKISGVKAIWTVDAEQSKRFLEGYHPSCNYLVAHIVWGSRGGLYHVPQKAQEEVFGLLGKTKYLKLPKPGTNPRGVEISGEAMMALVNHALTRKIEIDWQRPGGTYDAYERWIEYWRLD